MKQSTKKTTIVTLVLTFYTSRMIAFDSPSDHKPFEYRYQHLLSSIPSDHQFLISLHPSCSFFFLLPPSPLFVFVFFDICSYFLVSRFLWQTTDLLETLVHSVVTHGGEGLIMRKERSVYEHGRSLSLLKVKVKGRGRSDG